jgi:glycerophosphoryl diester phosphodiesterase
MAWDSARPRTWQPDIEKGPLVIAHRGASVRETENTLAAFRRAMADGADGVELDVQCCRTGEVVVFHDDDLTRLAGRPERIDELPFDALRKVTLNGGGEVATLAQAFDACGLEALVNVEIKFAGLLPGAALVDRVADVIARAGAGPRVLVSSFSPGVIWLWRRRHPGVACALLFERPRPFHRPWPLRMDALVPLLRPFAVHPEERLCTFHSVAGWRRRGYAVNAWTVDAHERIEALARMGISGIVTNDPAKARSVLTLTRRSVGV